MSAPRGSPWGSPRGMGIRGMGIRGMGIRGMGILCRALDSGRLSGGVRTFAQDAGPGRAKPVRMTIPASVRAFLQGLDFHDSNLLARCLNMNQKGLDQVARVGIAPSEAKARFLQEEGLVDSLLDAAGVDELQAFVLACRFLTRLRPPGAGVLDRVASGSSHSSPLGDKVLGLCCGSGNTSEFPVSITLQNLLALEPWLYSYQQEQRWYDLMSFLLDHLAALIMLSRTSPSAPERIRKQAGKARNLLPWVLQQDGLRIDGRQHRGGDYLVRRALDALVEFDSWNAEARLRDWYRNWLALPPAYERLPEPQFTEHAQLSLRNWRPSSYGGRLSTLALALAETAPRQTHKSRPAAGRGAVSGEGDAASGSTRHRPPGMVDAVHEWLNLTHPDDLLRLPTGWKRRVLVVAGLLWQGGPEVEASVVPAAERILSAGPALDEAGRQQALQCLQWAFCHCLYETVHRQDATLITQLPYAASHDKSCAVSGLESASSQEFLTRRLLLTPEGMAFLPLVVRHPSPLQFVLGAPDALVLDSLYLVMLAEQFLVSLDAQAFWRANESRLTRGA